MVRIEFVEKLAGELMLWRGQNKFRCQFQILKEFVAIEKQSR